MLGVDKDEAEVRSSFISDPFAKQYHNQMIQQLKPIVNKTGGLAARFSRSSPELVHLLELMLEYNPAFRPSAKQLLKLPIFDDIRISTLEHWATKTQ